MSVAELAAPEGAQASLGSQAPAHGRWAALREDPRAHSAALWLLLPLALTALCWRELPLKPSYGEGAGLTTSWEAGVHMALHEGITFGSHLIFTYGPLGFLSSPTLFYGERGRSRCSTRCCCASCSALARVRGRPAHATARSSARSWRWSSSTPASTRWRRCPSWCSRCGCSTAIPASDGGSACWRSAGAVAGVELLNKSSVGIELAVLAVILALASQGRRLRQPARRARRDGDRVPRGVAHQRPAAGRTVGLRAPLRADHLRLLGRDGLRIPGPGLGVLRRLHRLRLRPRGGREDDRRGAPLAGAGASSRCGSPSASSSSRRASPATTPTTASSSSPR